MHLFRLLFLIAFSGTAIAEEKRVLSFDALYTEVGFRRSVEEAFPGLSFGFYQWTGNWIFGVMEDFDHDRVLLLVPNEGTGDASVELNGKLLEMPVGERATLRIAGIVWTSEGKENNPDSATDTRIGYWLKMKSTDRLQIVENLTHPVKGKFRAIYDPDNGWQTTSALRVSDQNRRDPADAYEISRDSLLGKVREVLSTQKECVVRLASRMNLKLQKWQPPEEEEIEALALTLTGKIELGLEEGKREVTTQELERNLELYYAAVRSAGVMSQVRLIVADDTDDKVFRSVLASLAKDLQGSVYLDAQKKPNEEKASEPGTPPN